MNALLDMLVDGKFDVKSSPIIKVILSQNFFRFLISGYAFGLLKFLLMIFTFMLSLAIQLIYESCISYMTFFL